MSEAPGFRLVSVQGSLAAICHPKVALSSTLEGTKSSFSHGATSSLSGLGRRLIVHRTDVSHRALPDNALDGIRASIWRVHVMFRRASASRMTFSTLQNASLDNRPKRQTDFDQASRSSLVLPDQTRPTLKASRQRACSNRVRLENRSPPGTKASSSGKNPNSSASGGAVVCWARASCPLDSR
jgi:hypothetical protein